MIFASMLADCSSVSRCWAGRKRGGVAERQRTCSARDCPSNGQGGWLYSKIPHDLIQFPAKL